MTIRNFAMTTGIFYLLIGVLGFFPGQVAPPPFGAPRMVVSTGYGYLFGVFPVNVLHNLMYLAIGGWALRASRSPLGAITFSHRLMILSGVLTIMGMISLLDTTFGLMPLYGNNVGVHVMTAMIAAYFGYQRAPEIMPADRIVHAAA